VDRGAAAEPSGADRANASPGHSIARIGITAPRGEEPLLGQPGEPLPSAHRARFAARIGAPLPDVRLHRGPLAAALTAALGVPAFTVGRNVVLGPTIRDGSVAGDTTIAHELAHAVQQSASDPPRGDILRTRPGDATEREAERAAAGRATPRTGRTVAIAADGPVAPQLPQVRRFKDVWPEFVRASFALDIARATALARELATAPYDFPDLLEHGIDVVTWLDRHGEPAAAAELLAEVRRVWLIEFISRDSRLPSLESLRWNTSDPGQLITLAEEAARAGRHDVAFSYLGVAHEVLSYYALTLTERRAIHLAVHAGDGGEAADADPARQREVRAATAVPRMIGRSLQYSTMSRIYDEMRRIYWVYPRLEREATSAGDAAAAAAARTRSAELRAELKRQYTWGSAPQPGALSQEIREPVEIAEVSYADTPRGPGLTLHGANDAETDLTQLPGLPSPREIGNDVQVQNLASLQDALMAQVDFQAEIGRVPEIRAAFGDQVIDLNDTAIRQRVWLIMFRSFAASGASPLRSLLALVGRYLKAYTIHTQYNVRDWGVSYLDSRLPTDLAGRAERDCGVYALTVAWDIYQTARRGDATLDLSFDLVTMLEHVTLIITDRTAGEFFMVNNDTISGPHQGSPDRELSGAYGGVRQLAYAVGPSVPVSIGTTRDAPRAFHDQAWTRYRAAVDWGLDPRLPPSVERLRRSNPAEFERQAAALSRARYEAFYEGQAAFSRNAAAMDAIIDRMGRDAGDAAKLGAAIDERIDGAIVMLRGFAALGPSAGVVAGSRATQAILPRTANYLYSLPPGRTTHPLARFAMAILRLHGLGRTPNQKETDYLAAVQLIADFRDAVNRYRQAGATGRF
jgi:hypothetical protein